MNAKRLSCAAAAICGVPNLACARFAAPAAAEPAIDRLAQDAIYAKVDAYIISRPD